VTELRPGVFTAGFAKLAVEGDARTRLALEPLALAVERQARINASVGRHRYGTKTPAHPGAGPAVISGTLKKSIGHTPIEKYGFGWITKVGPTLGFTPPYGTRPTPADKYGYYLETGLRNGATYPWLKPAAEFACRISAVTIYNRLYGSAWGRVF
jgi:hypothetical protein